MNASRDALSVLRQAREILLARLVERIVDAREELLDDARGESYQGEIESLHERFGMKLNHLNQLLSAMPPEPGEEPARGSEALDDGLNDPMNRGPIEPALPRLPAPSGMAFVSESDGDAIVRNVTTIVAPAGTLAAFVASALRGHESDAAWSLATLLDCPRDQAVVCARVFMERHRDDVDAAEIVASIRRRIFAGGHNDGLMSLWDLFGLSGFHAVAALQTLRSRIATDA